jgi:23S rRNA pseudouridine1911/1915/1917 synthase
MLMKMDKRFEFIVASTGERLDKYVAEQCQISRSYAQKLIDDGQVAVNGHAAKSSQKLNVGDRIVVNIPPPSIISLSPEDIPLKVVYEDNDLLVIDKPAGLVVHPAAGHRSGTLVNAILARCPDLGSINGTIRPGIVHRLDKDTSGLMMVAKNEAAQINLSRQIKQRSIKKGYLALVLGHLSPERGVIEAPIGRHPKDRKRMAVISGGREARTEYRVIKYFDDYTLVEAMPETGRTHQIRVHFAAIGHPIFGDHIYGKRSPLLGRQFLHAHRLGFKLPSSGEFVEFRAGLSPDLEEVLKQLDFGERFFIKAF